MTAELAILSPRQSADVVDLGNNFFRKRVLPVGSITYNGRKLSFDKAYLNDLAQSFKENAFDQVAFQLADKDNTHTVDPERFRGEVKGFDVLDDGLWMTMEATPDGAELLRKNPKLGVSARILEGLNRADGKKFKRAIHHVLGTLDPKVVGLGPWQAVSLSEEAVDTIDLTQEEVTTLSDQSGTAPPTSGGAPPPTSDAPPSTDRPAGTSADPEPVMDVDNLDDLDFDDITDEELASAASSLSNPSQPAVELTGELGTEQTNLARIQELEIKLAREEFKNEAAALVKDGVPPVLVELARPILELPQTPVIDLANGQIDVAGVIRDMLNESKGLIELGREKGSLEGQMTPELDADRVLESWT